MFAFICTDILPGIWVRKGMIKEAKNPAWVAGF
jgi:hypothetical protein